MSTLTKAILLWPFTFIGFVMTYVIYKKSNSDLTYKEWITTIVKQWTEDGSPEEKTMEYLKNE